MLAQLKVQGNQNAGRVDTGGSFDARSVASNASGVSLAIGSLRIPGLQQNLWVVSGSGS